MPRCSVCRASVFATNEALCDDCGDIFCPDHIDPDAHDCGFPKERGDRHPDPSVSDADLKQTDPDTAASHAPPNGMGSGADESSDLQRLAAGAIIALVGVAFAMTGFGIVFGVPMMILGFAVMFPRFSVAMTLLAVVVFVALLISL